MTKPRAGAVLAPIAKYRSAFAAAVLATLPVPGAVAQTPAAPNPPPPVSAEPQSTTATYADWTLRCQRANDAQQGPRQCEVAQTVQAQQATILQSGIARTNPKQPFQLVVIVPANVSFPSVLRISVNDNDPAPVGINWKYCASGGCVAETNITDDVMKRWRAQTERGRIQIKDAAGRDATVPFSFRGLAQALDALAKA